jgi:hypothetical protein
MKSALSSLMKIPTKSPASSTGFDEITDAALPRGRRSRSNFWWMTRKAASSRESFARCKHEVNVLQAQTGKHPRNLGAESQDPIEE